MAWKKQFTEVLADYLRFFARGALITNGILAALASVYVVGKFLWHFIRYLDRTIFSAPW